MPAIHIRDVPDDVHATYVKRAQAAHQSLQQYMRGLLIREARRPSVADLLAYAGEQAKAIGSEYSFDDVTADLHALRDRSDTA